MLHPAVGKSSLRSEVGIGATSFNRCRDTQGFPDNANLGQAPRMVGSAVAILEAPARQRRAVVEKCLQRRTDLDPIEKDLADPAVGVETDGQQVAARAFARLHRMLEFEGQRHPAVGKPATVHLTPPIVVYAIRYRGAIPAARPGARGQGSSDARATASPIRSERGCSRPGSRSPGIQWAKVLHPVVDCQLGDGKSAA